MHKEIDLVTIEGQITDFFLRTPSLKSHKSRKQNHKVTKKSHKKIENHKITLNCAAVLNDVTEFAIHVIEFCTNVFRDMELILIYTFIFISS